MQYLNIAAYKFVTLDETALAQLRAHLKQHALANQLKGTILLSTEGINCFLSGTEENIKQFQQTLEQQTEFNDLTYKNSWSDHQPFTRMLVRLKKEIIPLGKPEIKPEQETAPYLEPQKLKQWYEQHKDMIILDTRNDYEVELGTFDQALDLKLKHFRHFPEALKKLPNDAKDKPIVTFCTGGIRCEKAAQHLINEGFKQVYQLKGGILNYFEQCGGEHYHGECFVFDKRVALDSELKETTTQQCYDCRMPLPLSRQSQQGSCPYCEQATQAFQAQ